MDGYNLVKITINVNMLTVLHKNDITMKVEICYIRITAAAQRIRQYMIYFHRIKSAKINQKKKTFAHL